MNKIAVKENFKWFTNTGYATRGVIYLIVGTWLINIAVAVAGLFAFGMYGVLESFHQKIHTSSI